MVARGPQLACLQPAYQHRALGAGRQGADVRDDVELTARLPGNKDGWSELALLHRVCRVTGWHDTIFPEQRVIH